MNRVRTFFALIVAVASVIAVTNAHGQSTGLSESLIDFGSVELGSQGQDMVTVTNVSDVDIIISARIDGASLAPTSFSTDWGGFVLMAPGNSADVNVYFDPAINGDATDKLMIDVLVNDGEIPSEEQAEVELIGTGGPEDDPCELVQDILAFFNNAIANGTLEGTGNYPNWRVCAMRNRVRATAFLVCHGYFGQAAYVNRTAILRSDGQSCPRDFVQGDDRQAFNDQLELLQILLE